MTIAQQLEQQGIEKGIAKGIEQGIEQGVQKGIQLGEQRGIEKGTRETALKIARGLLDMGISLQSVLEITGLQEEELTQTNH